MAADTGELGSVPKTQSQQFHDDLNRAAAVPDGYIDAAGIYLLVGALNIADADAIRLKALGIVTRLRGYDTEWKARAEHVQRVGAHGTFPATLTTWVERSELSDIALEKLRLLARLWIILPEEIREAAIYAALRHPDLPYDSKLAVSAQLANQRKFSGFTAKEIEFFLDQFLKDPSHAYHAAGSFGPFIKWHRRLQTLRNSASPSS